MKPIKTEVEWISDRVEKLDDATHNIIAMLDLDVVSGNSPHVHSQLGLDLRELSDLLSQARNMADKIAGYQSHTGTTYKPKPRKVRCATA